MEKQMIIRIDDKLKNGLSNIAKSEGKTSSQVIRELVKTYVTERDIKPYIDKIWRNIGDKLKAKNIKVSKVASAIKQVRKDNK